MKSRLTLRELPHVTPGEWDDLISRYPNDTVFHSSSWHQALNECLPGEVRRFQIEQDGQTCGHWCGFMVTKFGLKVFGAPLPGTATDYMYPLFVSAPPVVDFLDAVRAWATAGGVSMIDLGGEYLDDVTLLSQGYRVRHTRTYRVDLSGGEDAVWRRLKPAMRNKVRKAEKSGVTIEQDTSPAFAPSFFKMLQAVFRRQNKVPTYGLRRIESVVRLLQGSGRLIPLVALRNGEPLASMILLLDRRTAYYWAGASYETAYPFGANDLLQWRALQLSVARGITVYDACGGGDYKEKFGGTFVTLPGGHLTLHHVVGWLRTSVEKGFRARQALLGAMQRISGSRG
ncbi:MAG: GNAT family N-acetyltransferase [Acidobacteriota bacterium]